MELDDFKRPSVHDSDLSESEENISRITESFRIYETQVRKKKITYIAFILVLAAIYLVVLNKQSGPEATGFLILGAGFAAGALYLYLRYRPMPADSYSIPVREFLNRALKRISYFNTVDCLIIIPLLLILGTGGGLVFVSRLLKYTDNPILLLIIWVVFFIALCLFGFYAGRKNWKKEFGALHTSILELQDLLNSNSVSDNKIC